MLYKNTHYNKHLQSSWNKYGAEVFIFSELEWCIPSQCLIQEQHWINYFHASDNRYGYNICPLAISRLGVKASKETRAKIKATMTPERRALISASNKGRKRTPEFCKRRSEIMKKTMKRTGGYFLGHHHTLESKAKLTRKGEKNSSAKLNKNDIQSIHIIYSRGISYKQLSLEFGVCPTQIKNIVSGKAWKHIKPIYMTGFRRVHVEGEEIPDVLVDPSYDKIMELVD
jgi:group I intron endonuclease